MVSECVLMMKILDMRTRFFLFSTLLLVALIPLAPDDLKFVPKYVAIVYVVLTIACGLDSYSRNKS